MSLRRVVLLSPKHLQPTSHTARAMSSTPPPQAPTAGSAGIDTLKRPRGASSSPQAQHHPLPPNPHQHGQGPKRWQGERHGSSGGGGSRGRGGGGGGGRGGRGGTKSAKPFYRHTFDENPWATLEKKLGIRPTSDVRAGVGGKPKEQKGKKAAAVMAVGGLAVGAVTVAEEEEEDKQEKEEVEQEQEQEQVAEDKSGELVIDEES